MAARRPGRFVTAKGLTRFPDSGNGTALRTTRILKFASDSLALAPDAGRRNEEPVGQSNRGE